MRTIHKTILFSSVVLLLSFVLYRAIGPGNFALLNAKGLIAFRERGVMFTAVAVMLCLAIPFFLIAFSIVWKYRADNKKASYEPNLEGGAPYLGLLWLLPSAVIAVIGFIIWNSTHALDPFTSLDSPVQPITIQVVALNWKWLFIYPEQNIATVNFVEFPQKTPIHFQLTGDAPMNTFWIPQLGGQVYAMAGMETQLHLVANERGKFNGSSTEINGAGYSGMRFVAQAVSDDEFNAWVAAVKSTDKNLTDGAYENLAKKSENNPVEYFSSAEPDLYHTVIQKFMAPQK